VITRLQNWVGLAASLLIVYLALYFGYRVLHTETWSVDNRDYVIFGSRPAYLFFRPASHLDQSVTGMGAHLGPHRVPRAP
jgi:hypothetical protein